MKRASYHAVSLFSNCGAGDVGYAKAGFRFDVMADLDRRRLEVCLLNHPGAIGVTGDLRATWSDVVKKYRSKAGEIRPSLLAACPPCQGMSTARSDRGIESDPDAGMKDDRNLLVTIIANVAKRLRPRIVVVENVPAFLTRQVRHPDTNEPITAAQLLIEYLAPAYAVFPLLTDLSHHGVPQTRKRMFLTFIDARHPCIQFLRRYQKAPYPVPTHGPGAGRDPITVRQALKKMKLPPLDAATAEAATSRIGRGLHAVPVWTDRRYSMVAAIPPHTGQSAWDNDECSNCSGVYVPDSAATCPYCAAPLLRPVVKARNGRYRLINGFRSSTYRRMRSDRPAATITTASGHIGSNRTIHPFENRLLSTFECALLQTLPRRFKWGDSLIKWGHTNVREMIGEVVPPLFTTAHGRILRALLDTRYRVRMLGDGHHDCKQASKKLCSLSERTAR